MASISGLKQQLRALASLPAEVAELRQAVADMNHIIVTLLPAIHHVVSSLNHDVHADAENVLPLFHGYVERLRLDADTAIGASQVIERQLADLEQAIASLRRDA